MSAELLRRLAPLAVVAALAGCWADGADTTGGGGGVTPPPTPTPTPLPPPDPNLLCNAGAPAGTVVSVAEAGLLCTLTDPLNGVLDTCNITSPANAIDGNFDTFATAEYDVGALDPALAGSVSLTADLPAPVAAGNVAGFVISFPGGTLDASLLRNVTVSTALNGTAQESVTSTGSLDLDVLGLVGGTDQALVGLRNTKPYNSVTITVDSTVVSADVTHSVNIYDACISAAAVP